MLNTIYLKLSWLITSDLIMCPIIHINYCYPCLKTGHGLDACIQGVVSSPTNTVNIQHSQCLFSQSLSLTIIAQFLSQRQILKLFFFHDRSNMDPVKIFSKTFIQFYLDWMVMKISVTDVRFFLTAKWKFFKWPTSKT